MRHAHAVLRGEVAPVQQALREGDKRPADGGCRWFVGHRPAAFSPWMSHAPALVCAVPPDGWTGPPRRVDLAREPETRRIWWDGGAAARRPSPPPAHLPRMAGIDTHFLQGAAPVNDEPAIKPRTPDQIFHVLSEDFRRRVVKRALKHRSESKALRRQRGAALRRLRVDGYRDASRAPRPKLLQPVLEGIEYHDQDLARAVLNHWVDSHGKLRDQAAEYLARRGMPVPEPPDARFDGFWTAEEWRSEREAMTAAVDGTIDPDSGGLMLCLLARRFPAPPPLVSPLFRDWLDILQDLRPNAPEWEEADTLIKWMEDLRHSKERELLGFCREQIAGLCRSLRERFGEELGYLDIDPDPWPALVEDRAALIESALPLVIFLEVGLEAYAPIRPQAASRAEEIERAVKRTACEDAIFEAVEAWRERVAEPDPPEEDASGKEAEAGEARPASGVAGRTAPEAEPTSRAPRDEDDSTRREIEALRKDRDRLATDNRTLREEKALGEEEAGRLREEVSRSRRMEEHWRRAYVEERRQARTRGGEPVGPEPVESVREAIAQAREMFPDRLLIKLNSRSNEDTPFANPPEVLDALAWLATAYRNGPADRIGKTCPGWFYKSNQSAATMGQFPDWYRTRVNGTAWKLAAHLGKGTSHDPHHTIRIAFAWDEPNERVIVGFVGVHQRNRTS